MSECPVQSSCRNLTIDTAKGFGIVLVFFGHAFLYGSLPFRWIFYFHMPLFFVLSGCLDAESRHDSPWRWMQGVARSLLLPLAFYSIMGALLFGVFSDTEMGAAFAAYSGVPADADGMMKLESLYRGQPFFLGSLWFLVCLIGVKTFFHGLLCLVKRFPERHATAVWCVILLLLVMIGKGCSGLDQVHVPFKLLAVPMATAWYLSGYLVFRRLLSGDLEFDRRRLAVAAVIGFVVVTVVACASESCPNMCALRYPKLVRWLLAAAGGVVGVMALLVLVRPRWLQWIGRQSLHFFLLEMFAGCVVVFVLRFFGADVPYAVFAERGFPQWWIVVIVPCALAVTALLVPPVAYLYGRFAVFASVVCQFVKSGYSR